MEVNLISVSDHGMVDVTMENRILLDQIVEGIDARIVNSGALAHLYFKNPAEKEAVRQQLKSIRPFHSLKLPIGLMVLSQR